MKPLPAAVGGLGFKPSARHPRLLGLLAGAHVDDVAFVRAGDRRLQEAFVLPAALPFGSGQRLAAAHDHLLGSSCSVQCATACFEREKAPPHHPVLPVAIAEDREASSLSERGHLPQHFVVHVLGDDDGRRVGGAQRVVSVDGAQPPPVLLQTEKKAAVLNVVV